MAVCDGQAVDAGQGLDALDETCAADERLCSRLGERAGEGKGGEQAHCCGYMADVRAESESAKDGG